MPFPWIGLAGDIFAFVDFDDLALLALMQERMERKAVTTDHGTAFRDSHVRRRRRGNDL